VSVGRHTSLVEAIEEKQIKRFAKEHKSEGDADQLDATLSAMLKKPPSVPPASAPKSGDDD
jgi:hypothetical protein